VVSQRTGARVRLSRVTLVGERRRIDLVLPADEPVGELLPDVLRLLDDRAAARPLARRLVTADGAMLAQDDTLTDAQVPDGAVLRLVREEETPAAPVVHDVADEAADDLDRRGWRWDERTRTWATGVATLGLGMVAAVLARSWLGGGDVGPWLVAVALAAAGGGALVAGLARRDAGAVLILLSGALGTYGAWLLTGDVSGGRLVAVGLPVVCVLALLGACTGLGRSGFVGAGAVAVLLGGWELAVASMADERAAVVLGAVSVLALGLLPRYALMTAGLTRLDDRRSGGASVSRHSVDTALAATHRGLALATVATAASVAVAGWLAVTEPTGWTVSVTALLAVVVLSRARAYPLAVEVVALLAAGAVLAVRLVVVWEAERAGGAGESAAGPLAVVCGVAVLPLVLLLVRPADHVRVRLRRIVNMVESVGVVALIPVAIGAFGVYGRLLDTF
jgi:ESX secretion system protein EccD